MKLTLFLSILTISQLWATDTYSQMTKLTLKFEDVKISDALKEIENKSEFFFLYSPKLIDVERKVNIDAENETIKDILSDLFGENVNFAVYDRQIILTPSDVTSLSEALQQPKITGIVTDETGNPLPGVTVLVKGTTLGSLTDASGKYTINNAPQNATLIFSFVGMTTQEIPSNGLMQIDVVLKEEAIGLEEVVVIGYGTQRRANLTGSVSVVDVEALGKRSVPDVAGLLVGVSPGLNIRPASNLGGEPGAEMSIQIRGAGSLSGGGPYILVDGVPMGIERISPNEVESVTVLKDAAASAIYGSRAPYGVVLITTKRGAKNKKIQLTYSSNLGWSALTTTPKLANSLDMANALNIANVNSNAGMYFSDEMIQHIINYQKDPDNYPTLQPIPGTNTWAGTGGSGNNYANANSDWYDIIFKDWAFQQNHNISLNGGTEKTTYYLGIDLFNQKGQMNFSDDKYSRYNLTSNFSFEPLSWMTISLRTKYTQATNKYPIGQGTVPGPQTFFADLARAYSTTPLYDPNGHIAFNMVNCLANGGSDNRYDNRLIITPEVDFKITKDWDILANFTYFTTNRNSKFVAQKIYDYTIDNVQIPNYLRTYSKVQREMSVNAYLSSNVYSTFTKQLDEHSIKLMVGGQTEENTLQGLGGWKNDLVSPEIESINSATGAYNVSDYASDWSTLGIFGRFNYNYKEKYLLEFNGRYDGSSRFGEGKRWGFFPSLSIGYNISKENFWQPLVNVVNNLKLRASYGSLGNQNVATYLHYVTIPIGTNLSYILNGVRPVYASAPGLGSLNLTWETSQTVNFGLDAGFFQNKLNLTADIFNRKTEDMFGPGESSPNLLGTSVPQENNATLQTKGVELSIGWRQTINDFSYDLTFGYSDNKTTIIKYNNINKILNTYYEGMTLGEIWGFETAGLFNTNEEVTNAPNQSQIYGKWTPGDVRYRDLNGDGKITVGANTLEDPGDQKVIGNSSPRHTMLFQASASYKGFDFSILLQGVAKRSDIVDQIVYFGFTGTVQQTSIRDYNLDFWTPENPNAFYPKPYNTSEYSKNTRAQSRYLQDASYMRLKNLQIGYRVPDVISNKIKAQKIRMYLSGENLLTFTKLPNGIDPETSYGSERIYPLSKVLSFGIEITL